MTDIEKEGKAFEAWYTRDALDPHAKKSLIERRGDGNYASIGAYHAFQAWLARARSERVVSVGKLEALCGEWDSEAKDMAAPQPYREACRCFVDDLRALIAKAENTRKEKGK